MMMMGTQVHKSRISGALAVSGGTDLVGNADAALTGESGGFTVVESGDGAGGRLEAVTDGLFVGGHGGHSDEALDAGTAARGKTSFVCQIWDAWSHFTRHRPTCHRRLRHRTTRHRHAQHHHASQLHHACHVNQLIQTAE
ncbi:hypothetical protein G2W53_016613 [Senna tora]|uniref:Uncharacterized protein n=1 Tax=Senna tora TaxID=362788 RepID=A0A834TWJ7_9FABA|nr:hypothetical protein G2W53_016613 [Senna tora]